MSCDEPKYPLFMVVGLGSYGPNLARQVLLGLTQSPFFFLFIELDFFGLDMLTSFQPVVITNMRNKRAGFLTLRRLPFVCKQPCLKYDRISLLIFNSGNNCRKCLSPSSTAYFSSLTEKATAENALGEVKLGT